VADFFPLLVIAVVVVVWLLIRSGKSQKPTRTGTNSAAVSRPSATGPTGTFHWQGDERFEFEVVGESFYQGELARLAGQHGEDGAEVRCIATLAPEDDNKHDPKAVAVLVNGRKVAHLSREDARSFRRRLSQKRLSGATTTCDAIVVGGGTRRNGEKLMYGIKLDIKPFE
jgi:hypothetical protein